MIPAFRVAGRQADVQLVVAARGRGRQRPQLGIPDGVRRIGRRGRLRSSRPAATASMKSERAARVGVHDASSMNPAKPNG